MEFVSTAEEALIELKGDLTCLCARGSVTVNITGAAERYIPSEGCTAAVVLGRECLSRLRRGVDGAVRVYGWTAVTLETESTDISLPESGGWYCIALLVLDTNLASAYSIQSVIPRKILGVSALFAVQALLTVASGPEQVEVGDIPCCALVEDMVRLRCLILTLCPKRGGAAMGDTSVNHVTISLRKIVAVDCQVIWQLIVQYEVVVLPSEESASGPGYRAAKHSIYLPRYQLSPDSSLVGTAVGSVSWAEGTIHIRIPYEHRILPDSPRKYITTLTEILAAYTSVERKAVLQRSVLSCGECGLDIVTGTVAAEMFPSGRFDENLDEFMCCENPVGPMSSLDLLPTQGKLRLNCDILSVHPNDVLSENVTVNQTSSAETGPTNILFCNRCGRHLGAAVCTIELMESWINGDGSLSATGAVAERSAYQAETLSDVRLLLHRVNLSRVSDCSLLFKPVGDFRVVYEQVVTSRIMSVVRATGTITVLIHPAMADGLTARPFMVRMLSSSINICQIPSATNCDDASCKDQEFSVPLAMRPAMKVLYREVNMPLCDGANSVKNNEIITCPDEDCLQLLSMLHERQQFFITPGPNTCIGDNKAGRYRTSVATWKMSFLYQ